MYKKLKKMFVVCALALLPLFSFSSCTEEISSEPTSSTSVRKEIYTVRFVNYDNTILTEKRYEEGSMPEVPNDPTYSADDYVYVFTGWDKEISAVEDDVIYKAVYSKTAKEYTISFVIDGETIATMPYTVETTDLVAPTIPNRDGYEAKWEMYELNGGNKIVNAIYSPIKYVVTFVDPVTKEKILDDMTYTIFDIEDFEFPEIPKELNERGYSVSWNKTKADLGTSGLEVTYTKVANDYTINLNTNGGVVSNNQIIVSYNTSFTLPSVTPKHSYEVFIGWFDDFGNVMVDGTYEFDYDISLNAKYESTITFDDMTTLPTYLSGVNTTLSLVEMNGGKVIGANITDATNPGIKINRSFLDTYFNYDDVDYVGFDLKLEASATTNADNIFYNLTSETTWKAYENRTSDKPPFCQFNTAPKDAFETYYISREAYEAWVTNNIENPSIVTITSGLSVGQNFYIDNIHPLTSEERIEEWYSFEFGSTRTGVSGQILFYRPDANNWEIGFKGVDQTFVKFTNDIVSDGSTALVIKKKDSGYLELILNHTTDTPAELEMRAAGYISYDIFVPEDSDATLYNNSTFIPLLKGWNTIYAKVPADTSVNYISSRILDTTGSQYVVDNIHLLTKDEFDKACWGFESGILRDNGSALYYYDPADAYSPSNFTMSISDSGKHIASDIHFDKTIYKFGKQSLSFTKTDGFVAMAFKPEGNQYEAMKDGFSFWLYSTVDIDATENNMLLTGNRKLLEGTGLVIKANTWTKITISASDFNASNQFLIFDGASAGTFYFDGFEPLLVEAE